MNLVADALIRLHFNGYMPQHDVQVQALLSESMPPPPSVPLHEMQAKKPHQVSKGAQQFDKDSNGEWPNRPNVSFGSCWNGYYKQPKSFSEKQKQENKRQEMYIHNQAMVHVEQFSSESTTGMDQFK